MAIEHLENVTVPEGTMDAVRELVEGIQERIEKWRATAVTLDRLSGEDKGPVYKGWFAGRSAAFTEHADELESLLKPKARERGPGT